MIQKYAYIFKIHAPKCCFQKLLKYLSNNDLKIQISLYVRNGTELGNPIRNKEWHAKSRSLVTTSLL